MRVNCSMKYLQTEGAVPFSSTFDTKFFEIYVVVFWGVDVRQCNVRNDDPDLSFHFRTLKKKRCVSDTWTWQKPLHFHAAGNRSPRYDFPPFEVGKEGLVKISTPDHIDSYRFYVCAPSNPPEFFGRPRRCGCSRIRGRRVWRENTHCLLTSEKECNHATLVAQLRANRPKCSRVALGHHPL